MEFIEQFIDLMPQSDSDVEVDTTAITQGVLPQARIQISIKFRIKCLGVELLKTIGVVT